MVQVNHTMGFCGFVPFRQIYVFPPAVPWGTHNFPQGTNPIHVHPTSPWYNYYLPIALFTDVECNLLSLETVAHSAE